MRPALLALAGLLIALPLAASPVHAAPSAVVTLRVAPAGFVVPNHWATGTPSAVLVDTCTATDLNALPGVACCTLLVPDAGGDGRVDGTEVLDEAAATGCISGWAGTDFGFGIFVTSVDGLDEAGWPVAWWFLQVNGQGSLLGVADLDLVDGDSLELIYEPGP